MKGCHVRLRRGLLNVGFLARPVECSTPSTYVKGWMRFFDGLEPSRGLPPRLTVSHLYHMEVLSLDFFNYTIRPECNECRNSSTTAIIPTKPIPAFEKTSGRERTLLQLSPRLEATPRPPHHPHLPLHLPALFPTGHSLYTLRLPFGQFPEIPCPLPDRWHKNSW